MPAAGPDSLPDHQLRQDGLDATYYTASKQAIKDGGYKIIKGRAHGGGPLLAMRFRAAPVHRALMSVSEMVDRGMTVVFTKRGGVDRSHVVVGNSGEIVPLNRTRKVYTMPIHLAKPGKRPPAGFPRRGAGP